MSTLSGLKELVDFPTRGDSILDNCVTKNEAVFSKCYPVNAQIKTDHKACILPAGIKLKPLRFKQSLQDYREHRKIKFHWGITEQNWSQINDMDLEVQWILCILLLRA